VSPTRTPAGGVLRRAVLRSEGDTEDEDADDDGNRPDGPLARLIAEDNDGVGADAVFVYRPGFTADDDGAGLAVLVSVLVSASDEEAEEEV